MQAPMFRMNERESNPNPYIGFIRSLRSKADNTDAELILKAIAAQMKRIMEKRFMIVGTLEEAEFNRVFAGRNWNHGQSIELVLRRPGGQFLPLPYITSVMCHEMAHIEQMNHGPKFQKLMRDIKADVAQLQARGNFGDGFWSDGKRLKDSVKMGAEGLRPSDFPEYVCGVTAGDARRARGPRRGVPQASQGSGLVKGEASHRSGRQTDYKRKAGRRINVDMGTNGARLDGSKPITKEDREKRRREIDDLASALIASGSSATKAKKTAADQWNRENHWFTQGNTRGKVAKSKSAAEMRAIAAEARLKALSSPGPSSLATKLEMKSETSVSPSIKDEVEPDEEEEEEEYISEEENDVDDPLLSAETRKDEIEDQEEGEKEGLRGGWEEYIQCTENNPDTTVRQISQSGSTAKKRERSSELDEATKKQERLPKPSSLLAGSAATQSKSPLEPAVGNGDEQDGRSWQCHLCTYLNHADFGRCEICQARPDGSLPDDIII